MNIIYYVLDSTRADHLSCYGYHRNTSPNIDNIAEEGVRFNQCISPSTWTRPVAASILSGLYPKVHGVRTSRDRFTPNVPTLPEILKNNGYSTVGIEAMPNASSDFGFDKGFDDFYDMYKWDEIRSSRPAAPHYKDGTPLTRAEDLNKGFQQWLSEYENTEPFFAFIWSNEPHIPFSPPKTFREFINDDYNGPVNTEPTHFSQFEFLETERDKNHLLSLYDSEIYYNDHCIGELINYLKNEGLYNNTMVIIVGDHGEAFGEHGEYGHGTAVPPFSEVSRVPCIVRHPDGEKNVKVENPVSLIDLFTTIIQCTAPTGYRKIKDNQQGTSLKKALNGGSFEPQHPVFSESYHQQEYNPVDIWYAVVKDSWKYMAFRPGEREVKDLPSMMTRLSNFGTLKRVLQNPKKYFTRHIMAERSDYLFHNTGGYIEEESVGRDHPKKVKELDHEINEWLAECRSYCEKLGQNATEMKLDDEMRDQLAQLGYLQ